MEASMFMDYNELMAIASSKQVDGLLRWLDRMEVPYFFDSKDKPRVLKADIERLTQKRGA